MSEIEEAFSQLIGTKQKQLERAVIIQGTAVDIGEDKCNVRREGMADILGVRLHSKMGVSDYVRITPANNSTVICAFLEGSNTEAVLLACSEVDLVEVKLKGAEFVLKNGKFKFKNKQSDLKAILKDSLNVIKSATTVTPAGPGALDPGVQAQLQQQIIKLDSLFS